MPKTKRTKVVALTLTVAIAAGFGVAGALQLTKNRAPELKSHTQELGSFAEGTITGSKLGSSEVLKTDSKLTYESPEITTNQPKTNAVALQWEQTEVAEANQSIEMRAFDGKAWTDWTALGGSDDRKDNAANVHSAMLLTDRAKKVQYRFGMTASADGTSPEISNTKLSVLDTTKGPDPTKRSFVSKLFGSAQARPEGPRVISRAEWGSPEATSSPRWQPEYRVPDEVVVHHTAGTVGSAGSAAAVRAVWYQHANNQGWGDIGYNYLVDLGGNIFQGRYYDKAYAEANRVDVVGGHTLEGHNYHSTGIATLGNFSNQGISGAMLGAVGNIAGYKAMPYGFNPGTPGRLIGHRDAYSTNCPGNNLYAALGSVRSIASNYYTQYVSQYNFDYSYQGQGVNGVPANSVNLRAYQSASFYLDLKNEGAAAWQSGPVRLATNNPRDRASALAGPSWIAPTRAATFNQKVTIAGDGSRSVAPATSVAPGEIARFTFTGTAPNSGGTLNEHFQPIVEGNTWFSRELGIFWSVNVTPDTYRYGFVGHTPSIPNTPNSDGTITFQVQNTGNVAWTNTGDANTIRVGTTRPFDRGSALYHSSWQAPNRVASFTGKVTGGSVDTSATSIEPGETAQFSFAVKTPNRPIAANEYFNLVVDGKTWLNDVGMYWPVNVAQNYHAQWVGQSASPVISKSANPIGTLYFDYKNTGSYPWLRNGVVRLSPSNPLDRSSLLATFGLTSSSTPALPAGTTNWLAPNRAGQLTGKVTGGSLDTSATQVNPGETARFLVPLDARLVASGTYREPFRLVADGFAWLEDFGAFQDVTVQP